MVEEPYLDNPAGRLHYVLQRFGAHRDSQIIAAWNSALAVEPPKVPRALLAVEDLIEDTKRAHHDSGLPMFPDLPQRLDEINAMLFPVGHAMTDAVRVILPDNYDFVLNDVLNLSRYLNRTGEQSKIPDPSEVAELVQTTRDLIAVVTNSDTLPPEIKALLTRQLVEVLTTLERVRIYGPEQVRLDVLAVAATVYACEPKVAAAHPAAKVRSTFDPIKNWMATVLTAVAIIGNSGAAVITWEHVFQPQLEAPANQVDVTVDQPASPVLPSDGDTQIPGTARDGSTSPPP